MSRLPRRRRFLLGALLLCDLALAQPARLPRVCILANTIPLADLVAGTSSHFAPRLLVEGFREHGWEPGRNVELLWRSAEGDYSRMPALARELAAACSVIVVFGGPGIDAALRATTTVPIVMATSGVSGRETVDGVVRIDTLARPGGNITGLSLSGGADLNGKRLELLKLAAPGAKRVGILGHNLPHAAVFVGPRTRKAAESLGLELSTYSFASSIEGLAPAFAAMARDRVDAAIVMELPATNLPPVQKEIHRLAERHRMAVIHEVLSAADSGGLMAYGPDITRLVRRTGYYVDRILRGAKAGDLPIEQPAGFELRVNLKAARAIGLTLPQSLLLQATRVIE